MCGRTGLAVSLEALQSRFDASVSGFQYRPRYNIAPGDNLEVIQHDAVEAIHQARWGLRPGWVDDPSDWSHPINARAETITEKPTFRSAFAERPCLVLADGFYEWEGERGAKQPYRIQRADHEPFAMAGIWEQWANNGEALETVTIITTDANELIEPIHERMPVILPKEEERAWLEASSDERTELLDPYGGGDLEAYPISTAINNPENDSPALIEELDHDQGSLDAFSS